MDGTGDAGDSAYGHATIPLADDGILCGLFSFFTGRRAMARGSGPVDSYLRGGNAGGDPGKRRRGGPIRRAETQRQNGSYQVAGELIRRQSQG